MSSRERSAPYLPQFRTAVPTIAGISGLHCEAEEYLIHQVLLASVKPGEVLARQERLSTLGNTLTLVEGEFYTTYCPFSITSAVPWNDQENNICYWVTISAFLD